jgi:5-methylcytosine-specific restriction enzyme A
MARKVIGSAEIAASYLVARKWFSGQISRTEARDILSNDFDLNEVSAGDLLQALDALRQGKCFTRSISAAAADYFVTAIAKDDGVSAALSAISAIELHIAYYESVQPAKMHKMRAVVGKLSQEFGLAEIDSGLDSDIAIYKAMSAEQRQKALPQSGHKPSSFFAQTKIFKRSMAVVAEVLLRADGNCEHCKQPAPFVRASNGDPFLEVHHIVQLAQGGDDTVANAIAVCPNCHRKLHFG